MKTDQFIHRHIGPRELEIEHMLKALNVDSIDALMEEVVPDDIRLKEAMPIGKV